MSEYAKVYLLDNPYCLDRPFEYYIPPELRGQIKEGDFVTVPFGTSNRKKMGLVVETSPKAENDRTNHKPIFSVSDEAMSLSKELLSLCFFVKEQTLCTLGDAARAIVPTSAFSHLEEVYLPTELAKNIDKSDTQLERTAILICEFICKKGSVRFDLLKKHFGDALDESLNSLIKKGFIKKDLEIKASGEKTENYYSLKMSVTDADAVLKGESPLLKLRSSKHTAILSYILEANGYV